jgi:hypothetical protein
MKKAEKLFLVFYEIVGTDSSAINLFSTLKDAKKYRIRCRDEFGLGTSRILQVPPELVPHCAQLVAFLKSGISAVRVLGYPR